MGETQPLRAKFLPDANLFVAAIRGSALQNDSARLLLWLIQQEAVELVGNSFLFEELVRYGQTFRSPESEALLAVLIEKIQWTDPDATQVRACSDYIDTPDPADLAHAATCLATGATLISNDHHFDRIVKAGIIRRLTISEALKRIF